MYNSDYIDTFAHAYAVRLEMEDRISEMKRLRLAKEYRSTHPELGWRSRTARLLRRAADRLAPEPTCRPRLRAAGR